MKLGKIAYRNIYRNSRRSLLSASAIAVAAMSIVLLYSFLEGMMGDIEYNQQTYVSGAVRIRHGDYTKNERLNPMHLSVDVSNGLDGKLLSIPGISSLSKRISFPSRIYRDDESFNAMGVGLDFETEGNFQDLGEDVLVRGRLPHAGHNEAVLGYRLAGKASVGIGDKITLMSSTATRGTNAITFKVTGLLRLPVDGMNNVIFYAPLDRVQYFLGMDGQVQEILVKCDQGIEPGDFARTLQNNLSQYGSLEIVDWQSIEGSHSFIKLAARVYDFVALFFFLLASTVILNTSIMVIFERMKEIGTLSAMGMSGNDLVRLFFMESLIIAVAGALVGVGLGILITQILHSTGINFSKAMEGVDFNMSSAIYPQLSIKSTIGVFVYCVIVTSLISILPSRKASRIEPVKALRGI